MKSAFKWCLALVAFNLVLFANFFQTRMDDADIIEPNTEKEEIISVGRQPALGARTETERYVPKATFDEACQALEYVLDFGKDAVVDLFPKQGRICGGLIGLTEFDPNGYGFLEQHPKGSVFLQLYSDKDGAITKARLKIRHRDAETKDEIFGILIEVIYRLRWALFVEFPLDFEILRKNLSLKSFRVANLEMLIFRETINRNSYNVFIEF